MHVNEREKYVLVSFEREEEIGEKKNNLYSSSSSLSLSLVSSFIDDNIRQFDCHLKEMDLRPPDLF